MASSPASIDQMVSPLLWNCLTTTPVKQKRPIFSTVLSSSIIVDQLLSSASLTFAPGLQKVIQSPTAPDISIFKGLPTDSEKRWAVYLLVLEKRGCQFKIYIGSGTNARDGVSPRLRGYDNDVLVPRWVSKALKEGYQITHKGLICWTSIPSASMVPTLRVLLVALEALFTFVFWAVNCRTDYGFGMTSLCPWDQDFLQYQGLCSHNPLMELPPGDHGLSSEELEAQAQKKKADLNDNVRRCREKAKAKDLEEYNATAAKWAKKSRDKTPGMQLKATQRCKAKAVKERKHYCGVCDHAFTKKAKLSKHLEGPKHAAKAALLGKAAGHQQK